MTSRAQRTALQYEEWAGNEVFFCGGRLVAGPGWPALFLSAAVVLLPMTLFGVFVAPHLARSVTWGPSILAFVLAAWCVGCLFRTGCMDPGICPRLPPDQGYLAGEKPMTVEAVLANGARVKLRYNETCHMYQPPRAHHCRQNDSLILKFDHHCPWIGTAIGQRNYRWFQLLIHSLLLLLLYMLVLCGLALAQGDQADNGLWSGVWPDLAAVFVLIYSVIALLLVAMLSGYHIYLTATNQTTYESLKFSEPSANPFDRGSCCANCAAVWCAATPPCMVDWRAPVVPGDAEPPRAQLVQDRSVVSEVELLPVRGSAPGHRLDSAAPTGMKPLPA